MKNKAYVIVIAVLACLYVAVFADTAHAYLDAGTGSMLLQLVLGGVASIAVFLKFFWRRILGLLGIEKKNSKATSD